MHLGEHENPRDIYANVHKRRTAKAVSVGLLDFGLQLDKFSH